jgi:asparagine synthase (glutamine-hydrolysing)
MCGLAGIYHRDSRPVDATALDRMTDSLAHRGPDARGIWIDDGIGLGHRRLAIRDLTEQGAQPFHSSCGDIVAVYNGEIYNDRALAIELSREHGFVRRTTCDTEILPAGWKAWGLGLLDRLEGIYAFALWDREKKVLLLARDCIGTKPLYVADTGNTIGFASEPKALLAGGIVTPQLSAPDVARLFALGYTDPDRSLISGVRQLEPGTALTIDASGSRQHRYWTPQRTPAIHSLDDAAECFTELFSTVVTDQLVSDVPVAVLQSGGIDSSLVSLTLPRTADVRLYTVRFPERSHDEAPLAQGLAAAAGRPITLLDLQPASVEEDFRAVVGAVDGALADSSALPLFQLAREVRTRATVALSGDGADEFFGGYPTYRATALASTVRKALPAPLWRALAQQCARTGGIAQGRVGRAEMLSRLFYGMSSPVPHSAWRHYLAAWDRPLIYGPALESLDDFDPLAAYAETFIHSAGDVWDRAMLADQRYYLPADMLMKVDRTSMAHGLEVRVPLLDRRVMDFAGSLDRSLLVNGGTTKVLLRDVAARLGAPADITQGRKKGFNLPMNRLLQGPLQPMADRLLDKHAEILSPYCSPDGVRRAWKEHRDGLVDRKYVLWALLTLAVYREGLGT